MDQDDHTTDLAYRQLHSSGWSVGEVGTTDGWLVTGSHGEHAIRAMGVTQTEAWEEACRQAEALGMLEAVF